MKVAINVQIFLYTSMFELLLSLDCSKFWVCCCISSLLVDRRLAPLCCCCLASRLLNGNNCNSIAISCVIPLSMLCRLLPSTGIVPFCKWVFLWRKRLSLRLKLENNCFKFIRKLLAYGFLQNWQMCGFWPEWMNWCFLSRNLFAKRFVQLDQGQE